MVSHGLPNKIHVSAETAALIENDFNLTKRGLIDIKGKGQMETYLLSA
jgi:hypothetical protein